MNRLKRPGDSHYDVLGVSPGATDEEINSAFHQLIEGEGYRIGVPMNRQWLRARQIKDAHETLADPVKRRAYDKYLSRATGPAPWALTATDPATDAMVLPEAELRAPETVEDEAPPPVAVPGDAALTETESEAALDSEPGSDAEEAGSLVAAGPAQPDLDPTLNDNEPAWAPEFDEGKGSSVRNWGLATAAVAGLGLVVMSSWPGWNGQGPTSESAPRAAADARQASGTEMGFVRQIFGSFDDAAPSDAREQSAAPADSPAASDAAGRPVDVQREGDEPAQGVSEVAASDAAVAPSPADTTSPGTAPAEAGATEAEPQPIASPLTPPVDASPATAAQTVEAGRSDSQVRSPAKWTGGGPTDADNRKGQFQGTVEVQVSVEPDGRVSSCAPVRGSGNAGLDAMTCRLVQERARFTPALNEQGRPVASQVYTTIVWGRKPRK